MMRCPFSICRISVFYFALFSLVVIGISDVGVARAFWPDFLNPWKSKEKGLPDSGTGIDLKASGEAAAEAKKLAAEGHFNEAIARYTEAINRNPQDPVLYFERGCLYYYRMMTEPPLVELTKPPVETKLPEDKEVAVVPPSAEATEPPLVESTEPPVEPKLPVEKEMAAVASSVESMEPQLVEVTEPPVEPKLPVEKEMAAVASSVESTEPQLVEVTEPPVETKLPEDKDVTVVPPSAEVTEPQLVEVTEPPVETKLPEDKDVEVVPPSAEATEPQLVESTEPRVESKSPEDKEVTVVPPSAEATEPQLVESTEPPVESKLPVEKDVSVVVPPVESAESSSVESTKPPPEPKSTPDRDPASNTNDPCAPALADFNQAIALRPNYAIFFYMRGMVLSASTCSDQNMEKAIENYNQAINLGPSNAAYYQERGNARAKLKQYGQAINDMDRAILIEPNNYYLYYDKGRIQEQMGMTREAATSYKGALELAPPDQMAPFLLALKGARNDNRRALIADYTDLIAKRPAVFSLYVHRGLLYEDEKKYNRAIDDFSTALAFQKDNGDLYFTRGKIFYAAGKNLESLKDYQTSCRLKQPAACHYVQLLEKEVNRGDRWVPFWSSRNNSKYFYDRQHLKTQGGSFKVARVRIEADDSGEENPAVTGNTLPGKERGAYTLERWEFNCPGSQIRISTIKRFDRDGQIMAPEPDSEKAFRPVFPGGFREKLYRIVCRQGENKETPKKRVILE